MEKKYKLTEETLEIDGRTLHRIVALRDFSNIKKGDLGGFIEKEANLANDGNCWIYDDAVVCDNARISGNAKAFGSAQICDNAVVYGNAQVSGRAMVYNDAQVHGDAQVCDNVVVCNSAVIFGNAQVCDNAVVKKMSDYIVFKNWWSSGRYFTWTRSNNMWKVGCFYGTGEELIEKAYADSEEKGREYERIVKYVETIKSEINKK